MAVLRDYPRSPDNIPVGHARPNCSPGTRRDESDKQEQIPHVITDAGITESPVQECEETMKLDDETLFFLLRGRAVSGDSRTVERKPNRKRSDFSFCEGAKPISNSARSG